jgi:ADP-dependent NAD(P)H-hydrate dehydratase / NAD(P)H-hydrate epimerase
MDSSIAAALLTVTETRQADELTIAAGVSGGELIEAAGRGVARVIQRRFAAVPTVVLCGPGLNGGDGFVAARVLRDAGWNVRVGLLGSVDDLGGDTASVAKCWDGPIEQASRSMVEGAGLVVDALFGSGLNRQLEGPVLNLIDAIRERAATGALKVVAVDMPSGVDGDSGEVRGGAAPATLTVSFFRGKPGHYLLPGRAYRGELRVIDIGIPESTLNTIEPTQWRNTPALWSELLPARRASDHKYHRGHAVVAAGGVMTGAAWLAASAARRIGVGMLTIAAPAKVASTYRAVSPGWLVTDCDGSEDFSDAISDPRRNAILVGPGHGLGARTRAYVEAALATSKAVVLDADALTMFAGQFEELAFRIGGPLVITPHDGEFARLFPDLMEFGKLERAKEAANRLGGVVVLKGADTVIAEPGGRAFVNDNAPPWLATGGTGDVLAGTVLGLLAQGMPAFEAAAAAVWLNGAAAEEIGPGLIAEDLPSHLAAMAFRVRGVAEVDSII